MSSPILPNPSPGFSHGLRQPTIRIRLDLPQALIEAGHDAALSARVGQLIQDRLNPLPEPPNDAAATAGEQKIGSAVPQAVGLPDLIGSTANRLLQLINVPSFDPPKIPDGFTPEGTLTLFGPAAEHFPLALFQNIYVHAASLIFTLLSHPNDAEKIDSTFQSLQQNLIKPLSGQIPGGKSTIP